MQFSVRAGSIELIESEAIVVGHFEGEHRLARDADALDRVLAGQLSHLIAEERFDGKVGQTTFLHTFGKIPAKKVILVGLGKKAETSPDDLRKAAGSAAKRAQDLKVERVATTLHQSGLARVAPAEGAQIVVEGMILATYRFAKYKTGGGTEPNTFKVEFIESSPGLIPAVEQSVTRGKIVADAVNLARDLGNEPAGSLTPTAMGEVARTVAAEHGLEFRILDAKEMAALGMNSLLAAARGSDEQPRFVHLIYKPSAETTKRIAIVGEGVTFDSGVLAVKTASQTHAVKNDKAGATAVIAAMAALAKLKPAVIVDGIAPLAENMPGPSAVKLGDVVKTLNGKTIEVLSSDAAGRLILADALAYAVKQGSDEIIDLATLTSACVVALGKTVSGIMGTDQALIGTLSRVGEVQGESLWQFPLVEEYKERLKSEIADLKIAGGWEGAAILGGLFLKEFVESKPWAHIDIAGPAWTDTELPYVPKGATGTGVRTLLAYILGYGTAVRDWPDDSEREISASPPRTESLLATETLTRTSISEKGDSNFTFKSSGEQSVPPRWLTALEASVSMTIPMLSARTTSGTPPEPVAMATLSQEEPGASPAAQPDQETQNSVMSEDDAVVSQQGSPLPTIAAGSPGSLAEQPGLQAVQDLLDNARLRQDLSGNTESADIQRSAAERFELPRLLRRQLRGKTVDLETIVDSAPYGLIVTGPSGVIRRYNTPAKRLLGRQASEGLLVPLASWRYWTPIDLEGQAVHIAETPLGRALFEGEKSKAIYQMKDEQSEILPVEVSAAPFRDKSGKRIGAVATFRSLNKLEIPQRNAHIEETQDSVSPAGKRPKDLVDVVVNLVELWQSTTQDNHLKLRSQLPKPTGLLDPQYIERVENQLRGKIADLETIVDGVPDALIVLGPSGIIRRYNAAAERVLGRQVDEGLLVPLASWRYWKPIDLEGQAIRMEDTPLGRALFEGVESNANYQMNADQNETLPVQVSAAPIRDQSGKRIGAVATFHPRRGLEIPRRHVQLEEKHDSPSPSGKPATDLVDVVVKVVELWQSTAQDHRIKVRSQLPKPTGQWDRRDIERVVGNVLKKAIDHSPEGGDIDVTVRQRDHTAEVIVKDYGADVFLLTQIGPTETGSEGGTPEPDDALDMELSGCRQIVMNNGGKMWRERSFEEGTTIIFTLPAGAPASVN